MQTGDQHLRELVLAGEVDLDEAVMRAASPDELRQRVTAECTSGFPGMRRSK